MVFAIQRNEKELKKDYIFIIILFFFCQYLTSQQIFSNELINGGLKGDCTIGVACGKATKDGRPMIWKVRDADYRTSVMSLNTENKFKFLALVDAGNSKNSWISLNERGFAILNSVLYDLNGTASGLFNGEFMTYAAGTCTSVSDFKKLLDSTNITGRRTIACFAVMDSTGAAAIFETSGDNYWEYNAADSLRGYVLRTNFSFAGRGDTGRLRFVRSNALFDDFYNGDSITVKTILRYQMRDFAGTNGIPYSIPFYGSIEGAPDGYILAEETICNVSSVASAVIQGVLPGESVRMSTFWSVLGNPATGIAVPYWIVGSVPPQIEDSLMMLSLSRTPDEIYTKIWGGENWPGYFNSFYMRNDNGGGLLNDLFQAEDTILAGAETLLARWRQGQCDESMVLQAESTYAAFALSSLIAARDNIVVGVESENDIVMFRGYSLYQNYPNPFNPRTTIRYELPEPSDVKLVVYGILGQAVSTLVNEKKPAGTYTVQFDGSGLTSGVYFYRLQAGNFIQTKKFTLIK